MGWLEPAGIPNYADLVTVFDSCSRPRRFRPPEGLAKPEKKAIAARRVVERPNSYYAAKGVRDQEDAEWWRRIMLDRLHEVNREYVERLLNQIDGASIDTLNRNERAFMERMANLETPSRQGVRPDANPWLSPARSSVSPERPDPHASC